MPKRDGGNDRSSGVKLESDDPASAAERTALARSRRRFLQVVGASGLAAMAGCTIDQNGIRWDGLTGEETPESSDDDGSIDEQVFEDGVGDGDPAETVTAVRDDIEVSVGPYNDVVEHEPGSIHVESQEFQIDPGTIDPDPKYPSGNFTYNSMGGPARSSYSPKRLATSNGDDEQICHEEQQELTAGSGEALLLDPSDTVFYPGAIVDASSIASGEYQHVSADRAPITLILDLPPQKVDGPRTIEVADPSRATVVDAIGELLSNVDDDAATVANMDLQVEQIHSRKHVNLALGAHFDHHNASFDSSFEFDAGATVNQVLVKFVQKYFSIDVEVDNTAFFADGRTPEPTTTLVEQVNFGRILLFEIRAEEEGSRLAADVEAAFEGFGAEGGATASGEYEDLFEKAEINVTVIGGAASDGASVIGGASDTDLQEVDGGIEAVTDFIAAGANYGSDSPGARIGYQLRYLSDLSNAGMQLSTEYTHRECSTVQNTFRIETVRMTVVDAYDEGLAKDLEIHGSLKARGYYEEGGSPIYARGEDRFIWLAPRKNNVKISKGEYEDIRENLLFTFEDSEDLEHDQAFLELEGSLWDRDNGDSDEDDKLVGSSKRLYLDDVLSGNQTTATLELRQEGEGDAEVHVEFVVTPVDDE